ncbi:MAG TPA: tetratricopeptide repeat protein [Xanthobacteraceae bacterium]|nr:tetratricopeptide repeat protein [Xanthobacteraceae bacterium]
MRREFFIALLTIAFFMNPAGDASAEEQSVCMSREPAISIPGCTEDINSGKLSGADLAWTFGLRGAQYHTTGKLDLALSDYSAAIHIDPSNALMFAMRGRIHEERENFGQALDDYNAAIKLDSKDPTFFILRGGLHDLKRDFQAGLADFSTAIILAPDHPEAHNGRCWLRATFGRELPEALDDCNNAIKIISDDPDFLDSRGFVYFRMRRYDDAIADYNAALKIAPQKAHSLFGRGLAKLGKGDQAGSAADIAAAKAINADIAARYESYGVRP